MHLRALRTHTHTHTHNTHAPTTIQVFGRLHSTTHSYAHDKHRLHRGRHTRCPPLHSSGYASRFFVLLLFFIHLSLIVSWACCELCDFSRRLRLLRSIPVCLSLSLSLSLCVCVCVCCNPSRVRSSKTPRMHYHLVVGATQSFLGCSSGPCCTLGCRQCHVTARAAHRLTSRCAGAAAGSTSDAAVIAATALASMKLFCIQIYIFSGKLNVQADRGSAYSRSRRRTHLQSKRSKSRATGVE